MIEAKRQAELFTDISNLLTRKIEAYAIGGTSMIILGLKKNTLDIDLVFKNESDRQTFKKAALEVGYEQFDTRIIYGKKDNTPDVVKSDEARIDLFLNKIITSTFSDKMKERAKEIHEFGNNLIIRPADPADVIIMKSATSRAKDLEDIASIIKLKEVDWNYLISEAENQVNLGNESAILTLGERLEKLNDMKIVEIPKNVLDSLFKMLKKQVDKKVKKK